MRCCSSRVPGHGCRRGRRRVHVWKSSAPRELCGVTNHASTSRFNSTSRCYTTANVGRVSTGGQAAVVAVVAGITATCTLVVDAVTVMVEGTHIRETSTCTQSRWLPRCLRGQCHSSASTSHARKHGQSGRQPPRPVGAAWTGRDELAPKDACAPFGLRSSFKRAQKAVHALFLCLKSDCRKPRVREVILTRCGG
jgi:hypothetical protein